MADEVTSKTATVGESMSGVESPPPATAEVSEAGGPSGPDIAPWIGITVAIGASAGALLLYRYLNHRGIHLAHPQYGYPGIFLLTLISNASVLIPIPGLWLATLFGRSLNPLLVGVAGGLGSSIGELSGYFAGVTGKAIIERKKRAWYERIHRWMIMNGFITIFLFAFFPNPIFDLGGIVAGTAGYSMWRFFGATLLGRLLKFAFFAWLGQRYLPDWLLG